MRSRVIPQIPREKVGVSSGVCHPPSGYGPTEPCSPPSGYLLLAGCWAMVVPPLGLRHGGGWRKGLLLFLKAWDWLRWCMCQQYLLESRVARPEGLLWLCRSRPPVLLDNELGLKRHADPNCTTCSAFAPAIPSFPVCNHRDAYLIECLAHSSHLTNRSYCICCV